MGCIPHRSAWVRVSTLHDSCLPMQTLEERAVAQVTGSLPPPCECRTEFWALNPTQLSSSTSQHISDQIRIIFFRRKDPISGKRARITQPCHTLWCSVQYPPSPYCATTWSFLIFSTGFCRLNILWSMMPLVIKKKKHYNTTIKYIQEKTSGYRC